jgi:hypothetical protein
MRSSRASPGGGPPGLGVRPDDFMRASPSQPAPWAAGSQEVQPGPRGRVRPGWRVEVTPGRPLPSCPGGLPPDPAGALAGLGCGPASLGARPDVLMGVQHRGALPPVSTWAGAVVPSPGRSARRARTPEAWTWRGAAADFPETAGAGVKRWGQPAGRTPGQGGVGVYSFRPLDPACARWPRPLPDAESRTRLWHVWPVRAVTQWQWRLEGKAVLKQCSS